MHAPVLRPGARPEVLIRDPNGYTFEVSQRSYYLDATFVSTWFEAGGGVGRWNKVADEFPFVTEEESKDMVAHLEVDPIHAGRVIVGLTQLGAPAEQHGKPERDRTLVEALSTGKQPQ